MLKPKLRASAGRLGGLQLPEVPHSWHSLCNVFLWWLSHLLCGNKTENKFIQHEHRTETMEVRKLDFDKGPIFNTEPHKVRQ